MRHAMTGRRPRNNSNRGNGSGGGGRRSNQPRMKVYDSNGPDVRIRGTAHQVCEKYQILSKDAAASGNIVLAESYLQHAEHYQRVINEFIQEHGFISTGENVQRQQGGSGRDAYTGQPGPQRAEEDLSLPASILGGPSKEQSQERTSVAKVAGETVE